MTKTTLPPRRGRDLGLPFPGTPGPYNAITDVPGIHVGYTTIDRPTTDPSHHATVRWMIAHYAERWHHHHLWAMPVIAETYDGVLNDINGLHVREEDALAAIRGAHSGPLAEGNVGGGNGMICYEYKGGTGTASRRLSVDGRDYTLIELVTGQRSRKRLAR